jgi:MFS family permease
MPEVNASTADLQWIVTAYSLLFAGLILVAGHLGDRMGRKRILQIRGRDTVLEPFRTLLAYSAARRGASGVVAGL